MYQDDPEVKCALINAAMQIVLAKKERASMDQETADRANMYLQELFVTLDDENYEDDESASAAYHKADAEATE